MVIKMRLALIAVAFIAMLAASISTASAQGLQRQCYTSDGSNCIPMTMCSSVAPISVTAGNTTQLVSLTANKSVRVCSFTITGSAAATTASFVYGTGTNCVTGTTSLTGAMLLGQNGSISSSAGSNTLFAGAASNAICLTAVTGNVTGFVSYAKY